MKVTLTLRETDTLSGRQLCQTYVDFPLKGVY